MIEENLKNVKARIISAAQKSGRDPSKIKLVAVSKTVDVLKIKAAVLAGVTILGENRVQEAELKIPAVNEPVSWHLIGHLQRNKSKKALGLFQYIHSVDSLRLAVEINKHAGMMNIVMPVLLQTNISGEKSKFGVSLKEVIDFFDAVEPLQNLKVEGLMTIPPYFEDPQKARPIYKQLNNICNEIKSRAKQPENINELSMGMSNDFEVAIEEGATFVRVGTAIFGERLQFK
ncbi:MAG: YggS family pyridoxal phosphate enzyme [Candidatus Schekmanbacteria bacterium RBG_13_48_7]|uniref:Pyridoxal phosphate homeostasis protein n=1 Tax=Candidatus Schekmanbacteria bacterium RBG_13_48_7 TaxID=1817878 RepID=A0A1F7RVD1_9BACT|nr:MAG: YggS family pyridoxal phosphate enzyme [Candidatus Schekmanbacteria bacterium RBG_13_48_7]